MRWSELENGELLHAASQSRFDTVLTIDKKIRFEQNLDNLPIAVIILDSPSNALPRLIPFAQFVLDLLNQPLQRQLYFIKQTGEVLRFGNPSQQP